jgi:hypothetical protein
MPHPTLRHQTLVEFDHHAALQQDAGDESESQEAVENLLESYFMQIDSTHDRLDAIGEYIDDTEEYPPPPPLPPTAFCGRDSVESRRFEVIHNNVIAMRLGSSYTIVEIFGFRVPGALMYNFNSPHCQQFPHQSSTISGRGKTA